MALVNGITSGGDGETPSRHKGYAGQAWDQAMPELQEAYGDHNRYPKTTGESDVVSTWLDDIDANQQEANASNIAGRF